MALDSPIIIHVQQTILKRDLTLGIREFDFVEYVREHLVVVGFFVVFTGHDRVALIGVSTRSCCRGYIIEANRQCDK